MTAWGWGDFDRRGLMAVVESVDYCDNVTLVSNPFTLGYPSSALLSRPLYSQPSCCHDYVSCLSPSLSHSVSPAESKPIGSFLQYRPSPPALPLFVDFLK